MPPVTKRCNTKIEISESSSVGRAQPCQGWGRGFESRLPLFGEGNEKCTFFRPTQEILLIYLSDKLNARVVELVDTPDLKSCALFGRAGSSPASSTKAFSILRRLFCFNTCKWASTSCRKLSPRYL